MLIINNNIKKDLIKIKNNLKNKISKNNKVQILLKNKKYLLKKNQSVQNFLHYNKISNNLEYNNKFKLWKKKINKINKSNFLILKKINNQNQQKI